MDFRLGEEQELLRSTVREFAKSRIVPHCREWDERQAFPSELFLEMGKLGLTGVVWPVEYGGAGMSYLDLVIVMEELSRADAGVALSVAAHSGLCCAHLNQSGSEEQKRRYLTPLARGEKIGCWGLTEPGSGSDAGGACTMALRAGEGFVLNGSKTFITNGGIADIAVVMAVTDKAKGKHGISAFVVERGTPGFRCGRKLDKLGVRSSDTSELFFEDCRVPAESLVGREGQGFVDTLRILDGGRIGIAAFCLGIAQASFEAASSYARQRRQFGRPIADFQATQFKIADMATRIQAARLLTLEAAWRADNGLEHTLQASMAKLSASEVAVTAAQEAVQIHGGYGFTKEYPVERYLRDSRVGTIGEGTSEIQRLVIARELLGLRGMVR
jgi:alkylation response protein AidB-like acyl-CoA dehydrogenase